VILKGYSTLRPMEVPYRIVRVNFGRPRKQDNQEGTVGGEQQPFQLPN
jgi:hypothetical protein